MGTCSQKNIYSRFLENHEAFWAWNTAAAEDKAGNWGGGSSEFHGIPIISLSEAERILDDMVKGCERRFI